MTTYTLDLYGGLTQVLGDGASVYLYGLGRIAEEGAAGWLTHLGDALGSVRQLADGGGEVVGDRSYRPYGGVLDSGGSGASAYGFAGEWTDGTGLVFLRARYYDPVSGRFVQRDPSGLEANPYEYVKSNPILITDPSGLFSQGEIASSLGLGSFSAVIDWFEQGDCQSCGNQIERWGLLRLLLDADYGDTISGITLEMFGRQGEIQLGQFVPLQGGCGIAVSGNAGLRTLPHLLQDLSDLEHATGTGVPDWRSAVHRYQLNGGARYRDTHISDLPDLFSVSMGGRVYSFGVFGIEGGLNIAFSSDRYGNDYVTAGADVGLGLGLPVSAGYTESYFVGRIREWGTGYGIVPDESELKDAVTGPDFGFGASALFHRVSGSINPVIDIPPVNFLTGAIGIDLFAILGLNLVEGSWTISIPDIPFTAGWAELDQAPFYERSDFH